MKKNTVKTNRLALKGGSYSLIITAVLLATLVVVNIFAATLPATLTQYDISASKLYSITSNTKAVVNNLKQDVTIYWIVQAGQEDTIIENLLGKYDGLSSHIDVVKKNPDVFPTFVEQYTEEEVYNNSLIVESGERYRYVSLEEIYEYEYDYYSYSYVITGFNGEGAITSAIDYVVSEDLPKVYMLEGHGEGDLPATFAETMDKANIEQGTLSLLTVDEIPEDADAIMIYAPQSDISENEKTMLADYAADGGKLLVIAGPVKDAELTNLNSLLADYGVTAETGIVIEGNRSYYAFGYPYILMPDMQSHTITAPLIEERYSPLFSLSYGLTVGVSSNGTVTTLLSTSDEAFSKIAGFELETYDKEDGDIDGPFAVALSIETDGAGQIVWFATADLLEDLYVSYSSGANTDLVMNSLSYLLGERESIAIRSKSMDYSYLTISEEASSRLKLMMIGILPLAYLGVGICVIVSRRKKQNETV